jgi:uncharacterized protein (DUF362 family)
MKQNDIFVVYGNTPKQMVKKILGAIKIEEIVDKQAFIGIKPNLVVAKPSTSGATTSPKLVAGVIEYLQSKGYKNIAILEGSWVGDRTSVAFKVCGYEAISKDYNVPLIDLQKDSYQTYEVSGMKIDVCDQIMKLDYLINMPVLKGHCQTRMTCALKNMKGCIPNTEKRKFHTLGLHKPIAYLNKIVKSNLTIVDGLMGDLDFEEGGNPVQMNRVIAGIDSVLIDSYVAELMGFDLDDIPYIKLAEQIGVGSSSLEKANIIELNTDSASTKINPSRRIEKLSKYIDEKDACSSCYGSLIHALKRLDENALLNRLDEKINIGQGFKGKNRNGTGVGVGSCTKGCEKSVPGCPPTAKEILQYLEENIIR